MNHSKFLATNLYLIVLMIVLGLELVFLFTNTVTVNSIVVTANNLDKRIYLPLTYHKSKYYDKLVESAPNQYWGNANGPLELNKSYTGFHGPPKEDHTNDEPDNSQSDFDTYSIIPDEIGTLTVSVEVNTQIFSKQDDVILYLLNSTGDQVLVAVRDSPYELKNLRLAPCEKYYIQIKTAKYLGEDISYKLNLEFVADPIQPSPTQTPINPIPTPNEPTKFPTPNIPEAIKTPIYEDSFNNGFNGLENWLSFSNEIDSGLAKLEDGAIKLTHNITPETAIGIAYLDGTNDVEVFQFWKHSLLYEADFKIGDIRQNGFVYMTITSNEIKDPNAEKKEYITKVNIQCTLGYDEFKDVNNKRKSHLKAKCQYLSDKVDIEEIIIQIPEQFYLNKNATYHFKIYVDSKDNFVYFFANDEWIGYIDLLETGLISDFDTGNYNINIGFYKISHGPFGRTEFQGIVDNIHLYTIPHSQD